MENQKCKSCHRKHPTGLQVLKQKLLFLLNEKSMNMIFFVIEYIKTVRLYLISARMFYCVYQSDIDNEKKRLENVITIAEGVFF